jgi:hypothetical protein
MRRPASGARLRLGRLLARIVLLLPFVDGAAEASPRPAPLADEPAIQRAGVIRERLLHQDREQGRRPGEPQVVQWWNWPNWGNWGNWPNWGNFWRNW